MPIRIALETSISRFVQTGLGVYAQNLVRALGKEGSGIEVVSCTIPKLMQDPKHPLIQKIFAAYWQTVYAHVIVPVRARQLNYDLIHYTMTMPVPQSLTCPVVATVHDLIPFVHPEWVQPVRGRRMRHGIRSAVGRANHIITVSKATRHDVLKVLGTDPARVSTVLLGANTQLPDLEEHYARHLIQEQYQLEPGYILCVGSIEPRKNLSAVVAAYSVVKNRRGSLPPIVIVGKNEYQHTVLASQIAELQLQQAVVFTGHVPARALSALYHCAGVFVYPSLYEGFGLPPLEAMWCHCPVITSNTSSLPEVVGDASIMVTPDDIGQIADSMEYVLEEPDVAAQLRKKGRVHVQQFTWERCAQETMAVYQREISR